MVPQGEKVPNLSRMGRPRFLAAASFLLAVFCLAVSCSKALPVLPATLAAFALASIAVNAVRLACPWRAQSLASLLSFFPAPPLAAALFASSGTAENARALAAVAFAFEARTWLLAAAARGAAEREALARELEARMPERAVVFVDNDIESEVESGTLREGHLFRLGSGQTAPADGFVTFGSSFVDENLTAGGMPDLQLKGMGSLVHAGTRNQGSTLLVRATAVGSGTFLCRLAARTRTGLEQNTRAWSAAELALTLLGSLALLVFSGPAALLPALLLASGVGCLALLARFEADFAALSAHRRWLWGADGPRRLQACGILVTTAGGVLSEGRPRLAALECAENLSEDAALGLLGPLARKLETPAAFALLLELRTRNIPLQQCEFFQPLANGGFAIVAGEELRWLAYAGEPLPPALAAFVAEHENAGNEIHLLERHSRIEAAAAFRDEPVKGAAEAARALRDGGFPTLLVSAAPKRAVARLQHELSLEHAQGESGPREIEALFRRLSDEGLSPAWVQRDSFRPATARGLISLPGAPGPADLRLPSTTLPAIAAALAFGQRFGRFFRYSTGLLLSCQAGLVALVLGADPSIAHALRLGAGMRISLPALAVAAVAPAFLGMILLREAFTRAAAPPQ